MRARAAALLVPLLLLAAALGLRVVDPPLLMNLRQMVFDEYQRLSPRPWQDAAVRIVDIDDESLSRLGQWPWPRTLVARLVNELAERGAAAIAFDIVFAEPDRTSPRAVLPLWAELAEDKALLALTDRLPDHDEVLAAALGQTPSVLGYAFSSTPDAPSKLPVKWGTAFAGPDPRPFLPTYSGVVPNLEVLHGPAKGIGAFTTGVERDGVIRRVPLLLRMRPNDAAPDAAASGEIFPSLAAEALRVAQGASTYVARSVGASGEAGFGAEAGLVDMRIGQFKVPLDPKGRVWLYDSGPVPTRVVPVWRVLTGELPDDALDGTIVFIGTSAVGLKDLRATPLNPVAASVEVHAQIAEQILTEVFLARPGWVDGFEILGLLGLGLVVAGLLTLRRPKLGAIVLLLALCVGFGGSWWAFKTQGWLVDPVFTSLSIVVLYMAQTLIAFLSSEAERRQVRGAFGRYLAPALVEQLAKDPSKLALGGEMRPVTLMFMDIRGFTPISEQFDAHGLTRFLNRFLTRMTDAILESGGTVDKYMGDAIMAFWNAPMELADHPRRACFAALKMQRRATEFDETWAAERQAEGKNPVPVKIGIGVNTDTCCVGNMGAEQRFDYSAIGDGVNLASRLEGQSKPYGVKILVSEATAKAAGGDLCFLEVDLLRVKGKTRPVRVFTLLDGPVDAEFENWRAAHDAMLAAYRAQDWDGAKTAIPRLRELGHGRLDGYYAVIVERVAAYEREPPPADWDGVNIATEK
jgi:adenylate cyclase